MKKDPNLKDRKLLDALEHIDDKYIDEAAACYKSAGAGAAPVITKRGALLSLKRLAVLAACLLLVSAVIPVMSYIVQNGFSFIPPSDTTEETSDDFTTSPEVTTVYEETTSPDETTAEETTAETTTDDTTSEETTAEETTAEETTAEDTTAPEETTTPPEPQYDGSRGLEYKVSDDGTYAILVGIGTCTDTDIVVATSYNGYPVTIIASGAFKNADHIKSITIPEGIKTVNSSAISNCPNLESISLPASLSDFAEGAVRECPKLAVISGAEGDTYTVKGNCLINVTLKRLVLGCSSSVIPNDMGIVYIGKYAFANNASLTGVVIPEGVTTVDTRAFEGCTSLASISFPESMKTIADYAFFRCSSLKAVEFPLQLKTIQAFAFSECTSLVSLELGGYYLNSVGMAAFKDCISIKSLTISRISSWSNNNISFSDSVFEGCSALESVDIQTESSLYYGSCVFKNCTSLKSFKFIRTYYYIPSSMFYGCTSLKEIQFQDNLTEIRSLAFYGCTSLNNIRVGEGLKVIAKQAFANCSNLSEFIYEGKADDWYGISRDNTWQEKTKLTSIKCSNGSSTPLGELTDHDGSPGLVFEINEQDKTATLVGLGNWWTKYGAKIATTYKGYPVTKIADRLFSGSIYIPKEYSLPSNIQVIGNGAFAYNIGKEVDLTLPRGLTEIGNDAFRGCFSVKSLTYLGSVAEWNKIKKGENWHLGASFTVIHCSDGDVELQDDGVINDGTPGLSYTVSADGTAYLSGWGSCTASDIVIATTYKGFKVTGIGDYALRDKVQIKSVIIPEGITYIDNYAFYGCTALTSIQLPEGLTRISNNAFSNTAIKELYIPKSLTSTPIYFCESLEKLEIHPDNPKYRIVGNCLIDKETKTLLRVFGQPTFPNDGSIEIIGEGALTSRDDITELIFPEGVKEITPHGLGFLENLRKLHIPSTLTTISYPIEANSFGFRNIEEITVAAGNKNYYVKENCLIEKEDDSVIIVNKHGKLPMDGSIKIIGKGLFAGFDELKSIVIPEGVVAIGPSAFSGCDALESVSFPVSLEQVGSYAFNSCISLKKVSLGDNVKMFGVEVFANCTALEEVSLPKEVDQWVWGIFDSCTSLKRIVVPYGATNVDIRDCTSLTEIILPETVTFAAFNGCTSLRTVILPQSMTGIFDIFNGCTALEEIVLPAGLTLIYDDAFSDCISLKKVVIEGDVTAIKSNAFRRCSSLESITLPASVTSIGSKAFMECTSLREIVFEGTVAEWKKISKGANWDSETALAVIRCSDGTISANEQPEDYSDIEKLPEAFKAVLRGEATFRYAGKGQDILLDDIVTFWDSGKLSAQKDVAYAVLDMDGDGKLEVVISSYYKRTQNDDNMGDKIILREENGIVYGYHFGGSILYDGDYMENIRTDGSFIWCDEYGTTRYYGYSTISFSGESYTVTVYCKYRTFGIDGEYFIGNTKVTYEEYKAYIKRFAKDQAIWYDLDRYPLEEPTQQN